MSSESSLLPNTDTWSADLQAMLIVPEEFQNLTGLEFKKAQKFYSSTRRQQQQTVGQRRLWNLATLAGYSLVLTIFLLFPSLFGIGAIAWVLQALSILDVTWDGVLGFALAVNLPLGILLGFVVQGKEREEGRSLASLFPLMDELDRYHQVLTALHVNQRIAEITADGEATIPPNQLHLLTTAQTMRDNLVKAMQIERLLRENPNPTGFDPVEFAVTFSDTPSDQVMDQAKTYQDLLNQTLDLGLTVQAEMKSLNKRGLADGTGNSQTADPGGISPTPGNETSQ
jgi:hypothetical protein